MSFVINENNVLAPDIKVETLTIKLETVLGAKMRFFYRKATNWPSGIELFFHQDGQVFTANILLKDLFLHPTWSVAGILSALINKQVHLLILPERLNQDPFFQIGEILNQHWDTQSFQKWVPANLSYQPKQIFDGDYGLKAFKKTGEICLNETTVKLGGETFFHLLHLTDVNHLLAAELFIGGNVFATGYITIDDFYHYPQLSLAEIIKKTYQQTFTVKTLKGKQYFYFFKNQYHKPDPGTPPTALSPALIDILKSADKTPVLNYSPSVKAQETAVKTTQHNVTKT